MKLQHLWECFECTDWHILRHAATQENNINLEEYTSSVQSYICKCVDDVVMTKKIRSFPNQKASMNGEVRAMYTAEKATFCSYKEPNRKLVWRRHSGDISRDCWETSTPQSSGPVSHFGHRQPRLSRHLGPDSSCPHVRPVIFTSASRSRHQVFLGLPHLPFPCGFQNRACLEVLAGLQRVWPIHLHRL